MIIITGMIIIKAYPQQGTQNADGNANNNGNNIEGFEGDFDEFSSAKTIDINNKQINKLITDLQTIIPDINLKNYDANEIYTGFGNSVISGINDLDLLKTTTDTTALEQQQKIDRLENNIADMEVLINNIGLSTVRDKKYNKVKSLNNGMEIGLISTPNTVFQDHKTGSNIAAYMVAVNGGCLSVGANNYDIYKCNDKNPKQFFKMEHVMNPIAYGQNIDTSLPADTNANLANINYPFAMLKSVNNENCLTNNHGSLTVQPCYTFQAQRWFPLYEQL
jgi:hypothetical protein